MNPPTLALNRCGIALVSPAASEDELSAIAATNHMPRVTTVRVNI